MKKIIPTYQLNIVAENREENLDVFFLDKSFNRPRGYLNVPYRRNFYAVGICLRGAAELKVNLETYTVAPLCLIAKPPYTINQWTHMADDFETLTLFFTKEFITAEAGVNPDKFSFFQSDARHVIEISPQQAEDLVASFEFLRKKYDAPHVYKNVILKNLIATLLYEIEAVYDAHNETRRFAQTRGETLTGEFKKLVGAHFDRERSLKFYAAKLCVSPKYLTETVKETTGRTASRWIAEAVTLEAKVLLQNPSLNVAQISDLLNFPDQSTFGKFFKKQTGTAPSAYKLNS